MLATFRIVLFAREVSGGRYPVMLRVTYARKSRHFSLSRYALPENWDRDADRFRRGHPDYKTENDILRTYEQRCSDFVRGLERDGVAFTFEKFDQAVFGAGQAAASVTVWQWLLDIQKELLSEGKHGNSMFYRSTALIVKAFAPRATLQDVDGLWLEKFEKWQRRTRALTDGGVSMYMRVLRAACNRAIKQKLIGRDWYPFADFTLSHLEKTKAKRAITRAQMRLFEEAASNDSRERLALDLFLFSFYTRGMNLADIAELTKANIQDLRIVYTRQKTGKIYSIKLGAKAGAIIDRYARAADSHLFPIYSDEKHVTAQQKFNRKKKVERKVNAHLQDIAERLGIASKDFTFYVARHSYATALKKEGVPVGVISEALGHSDVRTTETYLKSFDRSVLDAADDLLT